MTTRFNCALDGESLAGLDERIVILDILEDTPRMSTVSLPLHTGGQRVLTSHRESITIRVRFAIHEEDPVRRQTVMQSIHAWAMNGGTLTISPRPGQQVKVSCTALPGLTFRDWPEEMTLAFTSLYAPWWEATEHTTLSGTAAHTLLVPGTADYADMDVAIINTNTTTVTELTVRCGNTHVTFRNISLPSGGQLVISHVRGVFAAKLDGRSILNRRTMDSSDELLLPCGESIELAVEAASPLYAFFQVRGRYA